MSGEEKRWDLVSSRGHPIVLSAGSVLSTTVTVECYEKWYRLILVHADATFEEIPFPDEDDCPFAPAFCDHVPNPEAVGFFAEKYDYHVDPVACDMLVGRWELEVKENYHGL